MCEHFPDQSCIINLTEEEILKMLLDSLLKDFNRAERRLALHEDEDDKVAKYVMAKQRTAKSIFDCLSMIRDPKFVTLSDSQRKDIAQMIARLKELDREGGVSS